MAKHAVAEAAPASFEAGDVVFYPGHGVGVIHDFSTEMIYDTECRFAHLTLNRHDGTKHEVRVVVGIPSCKIVPIRTFVGKVSIRYAEKILAQRTSLSSPFRKIAWFAAFAALQRKVLESKSLAEILEMTNDLCRYANKGERSVSEKDALRKWRCWIVDALSYHTGKQPEEILKRLNKALTKSGKYPFPD